MTDPKSSTEFDRATLARFEPAQRFVSHSLSNGCTLAGHEMVYADDVGMTVEQPPGLFLGIMLSGKSTSIRLADTGELSIPVGRPIIINFDVPTECTNSYKAGEHCSGVGIMMPRASLASAQDGSLLDLSFLQSYADRSTDIDVLPTSHRISRLAQHVLEIDTEEAGSELMLEGLALQLFGQFRSDLENAAQASRGALSQRDWARVQKVAEYLDQNIEVTPSLKALSRFAGINQTTLSNHFKAEHGETIFAYLRNRRLDSARAILRTEEISIIELSLRVGFSNPTSFSTAFRRRFGYPPSQETRHI
ncbi:MAG: AraC family transcriptional regulator [Pseudomonadota bacterium]